LSADNNNLSVDNNKAKVFLILHVKRLYLGLKLQQMFKIPMFAYGALSPTLLPRPKTPASLPSPDSNSPDLVQSAINFDILVRAIIGIAGLVILGIFIYFVRAMYYLHNQLKEAGDAPSFIIKVSMLFCNQMNGTNVDI